MDILIFYVVREETQKKLLFSGRSGSYFSSIFLSLTCSVRIWFEKIYILLLRESREKGYDERENKRREKRIKERKNQKGKELRQNFALQREKNIFYPNLYGTYIYNLGIKHNFEKGGWGRIRFSGKMHTPAYGGKKYFCK